MSFFNLKEAIEEYILEHTLQEQIAKEEFEYQVYLDNNNQLIVNMFFHVNNYNPLEESLLEYDSSMILMKCSEDLAQAHFNDDTLNIFLEDMLLPNLPRHSDFNDKWVIRIHPEYIIGNSTVFKSQVSRTRHSISAMTVTGANLCPEIVHSTTSGIDPRNLTFKVMKTRSRDADYPTVFAAASKIIWDWDEDTPVPTSCSPP